MAQQRKTPAPRKKPYDDEIPSDIEMIVNHGARSFTVQVPTQEGEDLESVFLKLRPQTSVFGLTAMTSLELRMFKTVINYAIERAEPIVAELDRRAEEALANGQVVRRLYRPEPVMIDLRPLPNPTPNPTEGPTDAQDHTDHAVRDAPRDNGLYP